MRLPIAQQGEEIARSNIRLLNCWLGIAPGEKLGTRFCIDCEYITTCEKMFTMFAGSRAWRPAQLARKLIRDFDIESEYIISDRKKE